MNFHIKLTMQNQLHTNENWVHFIGIGGVAMAPIALEMQRLGYIVTGSDKELYEPIKGLLASGNLHIFKEFDYKNLINAQEATMPGLVICGSGISLQNKEYLFAKKQGLNVKHYPELLAEKVIVPGNSIVVTGTYAKTTVTAMLVKIFATLSKKTSYMYGALPVDASSSVKFKATGTEFSIVEGDEYISSRYDKKSKFYYYSPKYLVITAIEWDHTDVFKTKEEYIANFKQLVEQVPEDGRILLIADQDKEFILESARCQTQRVSIDELKTWGEMNNISTNLIGEYNYINACISAYFTQMLSLSDITLDTVRQALLDFTGIRRRMEKRFESNDKQIIVFDDFASSPAKVKGTLSTIKKAYPDYRITAIYEPNIGNRTSESLQTFPGVFRNADCVILPKFSEIIKSDNYPVTNESLKQLITADGVETISCNDDQMLGEAALRQANAGGKSLIVFMASSGMEERIKSLIDNLSQK